MTNPVAPPPAKVQFPVEVIGADLNGQQFSELTRTITVHRNGISIRLVNSLAPDSEVIVRNPQSGEEALAFVVGQIQDEKNGAVYGLGFLEPAADPWSIQIPDSGAAKVLHLSCSSCGLAGAVSLSDIELEIFEATRELKRVCETCNFPRIWRESNREATEKKPSRSTRPSVAGSADQSVDKAAGQTTDQEPTPNLIPSPLDERRKNRRTAMKMTACIRFAGMEVVVQCEDMSKGGFRFTSSKEYPQGTRVEVAVPYTKFANNIFAVAGISYCVKLPNGQFRHGVTYSRVPGPSGRN